MWISRCPRTICWKAYCFPPVNYLVILAENQFTINECVSFWTLNLLPSSICLSLCKYQQSWLLWLYSKFWNQALWMLQLCSFFKTVLAILDPLHFRMNFRVSMSISAKLSAETLIGIALNLDQFGEYYPLNNIKLSNPWNKIFFPLFQSSLILFKDVFHRVRFTSLILLLLILFLSIWVFLMLL